MVYRKFRAWDGTKMLNCDDEGYGWTEQWSLNEILRIDYLTYMQYTGLKDRNGVEIYEGDILRYMIGDHPAVCSVVAGQYPIYLDEWGIVHYTTGYALKWHDEEESYNDMHRVNEVAEVIGNIYENKELLDV